MCKFESGRSIRAERGFKSDRLLGKLFDMVNPFSAALNTFDSVVIDSQPFSMQLGRFSVTLIWLALTWWFARRSAQTMEI